MALSRRFSKGGAKAVGSQKGFPIRSLRIAGSRRHGVLTFPGLEPVLQQAGDPMRTVLVKNGILVDSGALRALGILIAGDRAPHDTPGVETPFGVTWDEGINRGAHRRHGFRQEHEPESGENLRTLPAKRNTAARFRRRYGSCRSGMAPDRTRAQSPSRGGFQHLYGQTMPRRSRDRPPPGEIIRKRGEITGALPGRFLPAGPILKG